jgi:hypothetical protein
VKPTSDPNTARITPTSLYFGRGVSFQMAIYYWATRIFTNNVCLKLLEFGVVLTGPLDFGQLVAENIRMANNIVMSWEFGSTGGGMAMVALSFSEGVLREFVRRSYTTIHCHERQFSEAEMDESTDLLVGGPLRGFLVDFVRSADGLT